MHLASSQDKLKKDALYLDIDATKHHYLFTPQYITSLVNEDPLPLQITGASAVYDTSKAGFRVYILDARGVKFAKAHSWRVNYLGYAAAVPQGTNEDLFR